MWQLFYWNKIISNWFLIKKHMGVDTHPPRNCQRCFLKLLNKAQEKWNQHNKFFIYSIYLYRVHQVNLCRSESLVNPRLIFVYVTTWQITSTKIRVIHDFDLCIPIQVFFSYFDFYVCCISLLRIRIFNDLIYFIFE